LFKWLSNAGGVAPEEMARTFNCGIGMVAIVAPKNTNAAKKQLSDAGETVFEIGNVISDASDTRVKFENWEAAWQS
jgi:phosphoribosylformylglycinamidine cyclo-ligase